MPHWKVCFSYINELIQNIDQSNISPQIHLLSTKAALQKKSEPAVIEDGPTCSSVTSATVIDPAADSTVSVPIESPVETRDDSDVVVVTAE